MNAAAFNRIYQDVVIDRLLQHGFVKHGSSAYLIGDDTVLALLRFEDKGDALLQATNLIVCLRHTFLRELVELEVPTPFAADVNDYPVKERPSGLPKTATNWHYQPNNLGVDDTDCDRIEYGGLDATKAQALLGRIADAVVSGGPGLLARLTPAVMHQQLRDHGENAWCERIWIQDYEEHLQSLK